LAALTAIDMRRQNLTRDGEPQQVSIAAVTEDFAATVEVQPILGRMFEANEFQTGRENVILLAHSLWTARYARADVVGRAVTIDDRTYTIVGVMPAGFMFPAPGTEIWMPLAMTGADRENRTGHTLACVGRLKHDVSIAAGRRDLDNVAETLAREYPDSNGEWRVTVLAARDALVGKTGLVLAAMTGASGLLLLVACANVASLLLTHGLSRSREIAIRAAVGADRRRVVRQLVTESLLLALIAGGLGIGLAWAAQPVLALLRPADLITWKAIGVDGRSLAFALGAATLSGILFGTLPALIASRSNIGSLASIRSSGTGTSRLRQALVAFEVSLALVLVIGAALLGQTLARLTNVDLGFVPDQVVTMQVSLPESRYADDRRVNAFYDQVLERIRALPGVRAVGAIHALPLSGNTSVRPYRIDGGPEGNARPVAHYRIVTPGYFEALRLPLRAGRTFDARDIPGHPLAVIVSDTFRRQAWADRNPVGARITFGGSNDLWAEVVGVVGDVRHFGPGTPVAAEMYWPSAQIDALPSPTLHLMRRRLTMVVSADRDPVPLVPAIRSVVASVDPDQPIATVRTMTSLVGASMWLSRASTWMLTVFGSAALAFALLGVFGAASYAVAQRRRELAVRIALGAEPGAVMRLVMRGALSAALAGIVVGLLLAGVLGKAIESLLLDLTPTDARTLAAMSAAIALATLGACWVPARRAARIEPMRALRTE
jgi:putative ABC transport system permease protein